MAKQYVQHISGQGAKWLVSGDSENYERMGQWKVMESRARNFNFHYLPKSEYVLCEPPERWVDVTAECEIRVDGTITHNAVHTAEAAGYRRRKVQLWTGEAAWHTQWAIIIEQKVTD